MHCPKMDILMKEVNLVTCVYSGIECKDILIREADANICSSVTKVIPDKMIVCWEDTDTNSDENIGYGVGGCTIHLINTVRKYVWLKHRSSIILDKGIYYYFFPHCKGKIYIANFYIKEGFGIALENRVLEYIDTGPNWSLCVGK
jgi:hypothetical protein